MLRMILAVLGLCLFFVGACATTTADNLPTNTWCSTVPLAPAAKTRLCPESIFGWGWEGKTQKAFLVTSCGMEADEDAPFGYVINDQPVALQRDYEEANRKCFLVPSPAGMRARVCVREDYGRPNDLSDDRVLMTMTTDHLLKNGTLGGAAYPLCEVARSERRDLSMVQFGFCPGSAILRGLRPAAGVDVDDCLPRANRASAL